MGTSEERTKAVAEKYGVRWYLKEQELLDDKEVQAVYVATPTYLHARQAIRALRAGKHVLCEKPMAMNLSEAEQMISEAEKHNCKLAIGYMMRFHAWHQKLKQMIDAGELGTLVMGRAQLTCWYPKIEGAWRQDPALGGGGALADMGSHCIDLLEMLFGRTLAVTAFVDTIVQNYPVEDSSVVLLRCENGAMGIVDAHFNVPDEASVNMLEIYGSKGRVEGRGTIGQASTGKMTAVLQTDDKKYDATQQREGTVEQIIKPEEVVNIYQAEIEDFCEAISLDRQPCVSGEDGLWNLKVLMAAYESAKQGKAIRMV
ncbi:Gfo/Idh/MocA family oxidoreductase [Candidatus Poribacteria bacterium]|nr:Gfo/Idh/MocA family oxidoreductase [Candidatus Poribacteria bacterium]